ncbi:GPI-anchored cell wall organization protein Ecm33 [Zopfia rhizophila CBS 207.26]|uniref:GPI-anchored cell wall organization protein Ecm33 n=1 Tax=Zopfia rhizophila CBS 207.26 TaxID=1314779 RepID=A0A6A6E2M9_9PEZI|nr:GPI-anchored cell wall organization protein Ecm33 [Zopfia rhizophila CBS 207.26]
MSPLARFVLPALAATGTAYAACSISGTTTIENNGDATAMASCTTFTGGIAIETGVQEPISISGVRELDGDLSVKNNSNLESISADSLETIKGKFELNDVRALNTLSFPKLSTVEEIQWVALPKLQNLEFTAEVKKAATVVISNTQLQSLKGINIETIDKIDINNNPYISDISMQLGNITTSLNLEANNPEVNITFPNLEWAFNMTFRNCSSIDLPSLETLNGSMGLYGNVLSGFAAPNLTKIGGALALVSNTEMTNLSLPELTEVSQNLQIANNTKLHKIDGLPKLKTIGGALDFNGNFTEVSLPALNDVDGAFNLQSTGDVQGQCDDFFKPLSDKKRIKGKFTCFGSVAKPGGQGTTPTVTGANSKKTGAASTLNVQKNAAMGLMGLAAAFFM